MLILWQAFNDFHLKITRLYRELPGLKIFLCLILVNLEEKNPRVADCRQNGKSFYLGEIAFSEPRLLNNRGYQCSLPNFFIFVANVTKQNRHVETKLTLLSF